MIPTYKRTFVTNLNQLRCMFYGLQRHRELDLHWFFCWISPGEVAVANIAQPIVFARNAGLIRKSFDMYFTTPAKIADMAACYPDGVTDTTSLL